MKLMGHTSVMISQRYVHPTPEIVDRAFERLQVLNEKARSEVVLLSVLPNGDSKKGNGASS